MHLENFVLEHIPEAYSARVALFRDLENAAFLYQQLLARNAGFEYAFVDASTIFSRRQLLSAVFKATLAAVNGCLKTPNVHSEIVASLSASNNIADAYRRFGISPKTRNLFVVKVTFPSEAGLEPPSSDETCIHLQANVEGDAVSVTDQNIRAATDLAKVRKYYKLNGLDWLDAIKDKQQWRSEVEMLILNAMALCGV